MPSRTTPTMRGLSDTQRQSCWPIMNLIRYSIGDTLGIETKEADGSRIPSKRHSTTHLTPLPHAINKRKRYERPLVSNAVHLGISRCCGCLSEQSSKSTSLLLDAAGFCQHWLELACFIKRHDASQPSIIAASNKFAFHEKSRN